MNELTGNKKDEILEDSREDDGDGQITSITTKKVDIQVDAVGDSPVQVLDEYIQAAENGQAD